MVGDAIPSRLRAGDGEGTTSDVAVDVGSVVGGKLVALGIGGVGEGRGVCRLDRKTVGTGVAVAVLKRMRGTWPDCASGVVGCAALLLHATITSKPAPYSPQRFQPREIQQHTRSITPPST